jgi:hypothetical protein
MWILYMLPIRIRADADNLRDFTAGTSRVTTTCVAACAKAWSDGAFGYRTYAMAAPASNNVRGVLAKLPPWRRMLYGGRCCHRFG